MLFTLLALSLLFIVYKMKINDIINNIQNNKLNNVDFWRKLNDEICFRLFSSFFLNKRSEKKGEHFMFYTHINILKIEVLRFPVKSIHTSSTIFGKLSEYYSMCSKLKVKKTQKKKKIPKYIFILLLKYCYTDQ